LRKLKQGENAHPATAERFRNVANSLPGLIWLAGTDKLCTWFNKAWLDFVGRTMEQEIGNGWAENVHRDDFDRCLETYVTSFDARISFRMEYRLRYHDGSYRWLLDEGTPLFDESGKFTGYVGSCLDIHEQKRVEEELEHVADALQKALIRQDLPTVPGLQLNARYRSAEEWERVGGDWYDAFALSDGRLFVALGDVTGHGIAAIALMSRLRNIIIASAFHQDDPGTILTTANRRLMQMAESETGLGTAICAIVDPSSREIVYATAGHPPPILVQPETGSQLLLSGDLMLGVQEHVYRTHVARAIGRALLVFYTDGLLEFTRDALEGEANLLKAAGEIAFAGMENPALAIKQRILRDASPSDDVAILTVSFDPRPVATMDTTSALQPTVATRSD
jgi:PAS domain S-box-containing protein